MVMLMTVTLMTMMAMYDENVYDDDVCTMVLIIVNMMTMTVSYNGDYDVDNCVYDDV